MNFLTKLFKKEDILNLSELNTWIAKKLEFSFSEEVNALDTSFKSLDNSIEILNKFDFSTVKIPSRAINKIKGNHSAYIISLQNLQKNLSNPKSFSSTDLESWSKKIEQTLNEFNLKTINNYHILKTIIGKELEEVIKNIRSINDLRIKINKTIIDKQLKNIESIRTKLKNIEEVIESNESNKTKLPSLKEKQAKLIEEETITKNDISILNNSIEFQDLINYKLDLEKLNKEEEQLKSSLLSKIIPLDRTLKKIAKEKNNKELEKFLEDKYSYALAEDLKLLLQSIDSTKLEPKIGDQLIELIEEVGRFKNKHFEINDKIKLTKNNISKNHSEKELEELKNKLNLQSKNVEKISDEISKIEYKELDNDIKSIENNLSKLGFKIKIKDDSLDKKI